MSETQVLTMAASLVATLFGLLVLVLGWMGNKLYGKLEALTDIFSELRAEIVNIDKRLAVVEARCHYEHEVKQQ